MIFVTDWKDNAWLQVCIDEQTRLYDGLKLPPKPWALGVVDGDKKRAKIANDAKRVMSINRRVRQLAAMLE